MKNTLFFLFIFISISLFGNSNSMRDSLRDGTITKSMLNSDLIYNSNQETNRDSSLFDMDNTEKNQPLIARRSGGRVGGSSFSSRSSSRSSSSGYRGSSSSSRGYSGGGFFFFGGGSGSFGTLIFIIVALFIIGSIIAAIKKRKDSENGVYENSDEEYTTVKMQFALHSTADHIRDEIKKMADELNFDNADDLKTLLSETSSLLMSNEEYIKYAFATVAPKTRSISQAEEIFESTANQEREKLSQETFKKLRGRSVTRQMLADGNKPSFMEIKEYIVFTIVATFANTKISVGDDYSWENYKSVLKKSAMVSSSNIVAVEIIWSPDAEDDVLTEDDITMHYSNMIQL
ncbi:DUF1517 domain-containing protein [bacterium]|nr:DUF1517 domain-containing protein [bacterium]